MLHINDKTHISVIIKSLDNIYNQSKIYGKLNVKDINYLNIIYKLINSCNLDLSVDEINKLITTYDNIQFHSKYVCPVLKYPKHVQTKPKFVQAENNDCNNFPIAKKIFYWVESVTEEPEFEYITGLCQDIVYVSTKPSDTYQSFNIGIELDYLNSFSRAICFNLQNVLETDVYKLYTEEDVDITDLYDTTYIESTNSRLFVAFDYVIDHTTIKIKKINNVQPEGIFNNTFNNIFA